MAACVVCGKPVVTPVPLPSGEFCHRKCVARRLLMKKPPSSSPDSARIRVPAKRRDDEPNE